MGSKAGSPADQRMKHGRALEHGETGLHQISVRENVFGLVKRWDAHNDDRGVSSAKLK